MAAYDIFTSDDEKAVGYDIALSGEPQHVESAEVADTSKEAATKQFAYLARDIVQTAHLIDAMYRSLAYRDCNAAEYDSVLAIQVGKMRALLQAAIGARCVIKPSKSARRRHKRATAQSRAICTHSA